MTHKKDSTAKKGGENKMVTSNKEEEHPGSGHTNENGKILMKIGIWLPKLFWPTMRKNCASDQEKLLKVEAEGREFENFLR